MAEKLRVHILAKELGVASKAVIDKCKAEGVELKNHMAAISAGLAESIREWFSVGADITSVEVAERVDVEKVRAKRRRRRADEIIEAAEPHEAADADVAAEVAPEPPATVEPPPAPPAEIEPPPVMLPAAEVPAVESIAARAPEVEAPYEPPAPAEQRPRAPEPPRAPAAPVTPAPPPAKAEPAKPVLPAGPQLVPRPAELRGPRVIRVEAPEPEAPRRAPAARVGVDTYSGPSTTRRPGRRGKRDDEAEIRRARNPRRQGGTADVDSRLREWRDQDLAERRERLAAVTGHGLADRKAAERRRQSAPAGSPAVARKEPVTITTPIILRDFCETTGIKFPLVMRKLMEHTGRLWQINQSITDEQAELLAVDLGIPLRIEKSKTAYEKLKDTFASRTRENLQARPPVVAILGHVDHGKTSLLDRIRNAHVAAGEAGGITQHIGAYRVVDERWNVTFIDTPGHEAFTAMRARGANMTDVVVLVVAADDGVMPQTVEALNHAKAAGVTIVVALNKIDLPGIDLNRVYAQLAERELAPSEWGGTTDVIKTSAVTGAGVEDLLVHLTTLSDLMELQADPTVPAQGTVIEAQMREGQGSMAQVLVREGMLRTGQNIVCGPAAGRVRALINDRGEKIEEAGPGTPVEVAGLDALPAAGDQLYVVDTLQEAKEIAAEVQQRRREDELQTAPKAASLAALLQRGSENELPQLNVILRADVQGSVEAARNELQNVPSAKARLQLLHVGIGAISEADVQLAKASGAIVVGFNVTADDRARTLADQLGVEMRTYRVIYELVGDMHKALAGLLEPVRKEELRGAAEVRQVFNVSRVGTIAGCLVTDGTIQRNHRVRLVRDGRIVVEGAAIDSLKRFKDDAREVRAGLECGIKIEGYDDIKPGDVIQAFEVVEVAQEL